MTAPVSLAAGSIFAGDYRIVSPLGEGGMGAVYAVEQLSTGKPRALKVMHPSFVADARMRERFVQEARVGARVESDHIVEVVGAGIDAATGMPWLAMELLKGETLAQAMTRKGLFSRSETREVFAQLGHALAAAHDAGVVHRDLKPENVFLAVPRREGAPFVVKVLDFGIAKIVAEAGAQTKSTASLGTPLWMAPEQAELGKEIRPSADVWALGLIAFYLLTGRLYWRAANAEGAGTMQLMREVLFEEVAPPSVRAAELGVGHLVPPGFDAWFVQCISRDVSRRFVDAREARNALDSILAEAVTSSSTIIYGRPPPAPERTISATLPDVRVIAPTIITAPTPAVMPTIATVGAPAIIAATPVSSDPPRRSSSVPYVLGALVVIAAIGVGAYYALGTNNSAVKPSIPSDDDDSTSVSTHPHPSTTPPLSPPHPPIAVAFVVHRTAGNSAVLHDAVMGAVTSLAPTDDAAVLIYDASSVARVVPMGSVSPGASAKTEAFGGGTPTMGSLATALTSAKADCASVPAGMWRHVIIVSDADATSYLGPTIDSLVADHTRVSVVVYGALSSASPFAGLAARGDGRFYAVEEKELAETLLLELSATFDDGPLTKPPPPPPSPPPIYTHPIPSTSTSTIALPPPTASTSTTPTTPSPSTPPPVGPCAQYKGLPYLAMKADDFECVRAMLYPRCLAGTISTAQARTLGRACKALGDQACVTCASNVSSWK